MPPPRPSCRDGPSFYRRVGFGAWKRGFLGRDRAGGFIPALSLTGRRIRLRIPMYPQICARLGPYANELTLY